MKRKRPVFAGGARDGVAGRGHPHGAGPAGRPDAARRDGHGRADQLLRPAAVGGRSPARRPVQLLRSGKLGTIRLPLYLGHMRDGRNVWYILTDTTDRDNAEALGLNHSAKLAYSQVGQAVREGKLDRKAGLVFDAGAVDFGPRRPLRPGPRFRAFPPSVAAPGIRRRRAVHALGADRQRGRPHLQRTGHRVRQERRADQRLPRQGRPRPRPRPRREDLPRRQRRRNGDDQAHDDLQLRPPGAVHEHGGVRSGGRHAGIAERSHRR